MKRICERGLNWFQLYNYKGSVRLCGWIDDGHIGNLQESSVYEIYHGEKAEHIRECLLKGDYSMCKVDACPYLAMNDLENHMVEYEEVPEYPNELYLGFERICNYACTCCNIRKSMIAEKDVDHEVYYREIEKKLSPILPHVRKISANGCGELFCSKHILKLLADWKPLAAPEEIEVLLESNGSLFDEEHWKQIENLGQYYLKVAITVMSFDEPVYQYLSGTKLPVSQVENNLKFIKSLREKGIVNYFEIATVVQEQNFRTVPSFVQKCIDEYQPDYIRLRPYESWGAQSQVEVWITDIRNPEHPYYSEYRKVMQHPILKHPTVHDWSGGLDTVNPVSFPYKEDALKFKIMLELIQNTEEVIRNLSTCVTDKNIVIYGASVIGRALADMFKETSYTVAYMIDQNAKENNYEGIPVVSLDATEGLSKDVGVIVTPISKEQQIIDSLKEHNFTSIFSIKEFIANESIQKELKGLL